MKFIISIWIFLRKDLRQVLSLVVNKIIHLSSKIIGHISELYVTLKQKQDFIRVM